MEPKSADARLTALYERHYNDVLGYCVRRVGRNAADEVAADVFAIAWRRIDEIEWETARPWLFGVARGVVANRWRSERRWMRLRDRLANLAVPPRDLPDEQVVRRAEVDEMLGAVRRLKARDREVLMLAGWEDLSAPEIAHALSITVAAAEQRLHRAKKRLAKILPTPNSQRDLSPRAAQQGGSP